MWKKIITTMLIISSLFIIGNIKAEEYFHADSESGNSLGCRYYDSSTQETISLTLQYAGGKIYRQQVGGHNSSGGELEITNEDELYKSVLSYNGDGYKSCPTYIYRNGDGEVAFGRSLDKAKANLKKCCGDQKIDGMHCGTSTYTHLGAGGGIPGQTDNNREANSVTVEYSTCAIIKWDGKPIIGKDYNELLDKIGGTNAAQNIIDKYKKDKDTTVKDRKVVLKDDCGILGEDASEMLRNALKYLIIASVILVIVLGIVDFIKAIAGAVDDGMKKAWKRLLRRIISLALLLLLPALITFVLTEIDIEGVNEDSIFCGIEE